MSYAQQQIIEMAPELTEEDANFVADFMSRLLVFNGKKKNSAQSNKMTALRELEEIAAKYSPIPDPEKEIAEARDAKYGVVG